MQIISAPCVFVMEDFNRVGLCVSDKKFLKLSNFETGVKHRITFVQVVKTKFGQQIRVELENFVTFLPKRFILFEQCQLDLLVGKLLIFEGMTGKTCKVKFEE